MPQEGESSQIRRRGKANMGEQDPLALPYTRTSGRSTPSTQTDAYASLEEDLLDPPRTNTSVVRYDGQQGIQSARITGAQPPSTPIPSRRQQGLTRNLPPSRQGQGRTTTQQQPRMQNKARKNVHWLLPLGVGMVAMLVLWMVGASVLAWGIQRYNDYRYGIPRTFQTDAVVGHGGDSAGHPSHFIAVNLNRQAIVLEFMAGDPAKSVSYVAPLYIAGDGGNLAPVTVEFRDVTGDGKPDMIIHIHLPSQDQISVFVNDGTKFRPSNGNDKIRI
ncbi:MAG: hypothetical protein JOZ18_16675 [Chloroflexi bacterium]|nr:hypothetical protein [Chloroflexota bacterium]